MTIYEALTFAVAFATLMVLVTTRKNNRPCAQIVGGYFLNN
ncbi:hypothetical protein [Sporomusa acidovorans]|nr:hypothetical protein [Sporomusa acidovorans]